MLVPILLSVFWAVCSTVLIQPWFWKGIIKRKTLEGNENTRGWNYEDNNDFKTNVEIQIFFGCITLFGSLLLYSTHVRYNFYGSIGSILLVLLFQALSLYIGWIANRKIKLLAIIAIAVICLFFSITDAITSDFPVIGLSKTQEEIPTVFSIVESEQEQAEQQKILSSSVIEQLFEATSVSGPVYSNGKFVYIVTDSRNGNGIVIINENDGKTAKFIACNFNFGMSAELRQKYPFERISTLNVVVSDEDVPFGKYAILSKPTLFGGPVLEKYALQNMLSGEITEYTVEDLPKFAE